MSRLMPLLLCCMLFACSDDNVSPPETPDASPDVVDAMQSIDAAPPNNASATVRVAFPPPISRTQLDTITVRGTAEDADGVAAIRVNGVDAQTTNGFADWVAVVPVAMGQNILTVTAEDDSGNVDDNAAAVAVINWTNYLQSPSDFVIDESANLAYLVDAGRDELVSMDLTNYQQNVVSGATVGAGVAFSDLRAVGLDIANQRLYVVDRGLEALLAVDIATGDRSVVSDAVTGAGVPLVSPLDLELDLNDRRALISSTITYDDEPLTALWIVDLDTGVRMLIDESIQCLDDEIGNIPAQLGECGTNISGSRVSIAVDGDADTLWALRNESELYSIEIYSVDLTTGARTDWNIDSGSEEFLYDVEGIVPDIVNNRVLFGEQVHDGLMAMNLASGLNSYMSGDDVGAGPALSHPVAMRFDATDANGVYVLDDAAHHRNLLRVDLTTGDRVLYEPSMGMGEALTSISAIEREPVADGRLVMAYSTVLVEIDPATTNRQVLATIETPTPPPPGYIARQWLRDVVVDWAQNTAYVLHEYEFTDNSKDPTIAEEDALILTVNLNDGSYTVLSGAAAGAGPDFTSLESAVLDAANSRLLLPDRGRQAIVAVDLANGNRSIVSDVNTGSGPAIDRPANIILDAANDRVLYINAGAPYALMAVNLTSGDRTEITNDDTGTGATLRRAVDAVYDGGSNRVLVVDDGVGAAAVVKAVDLATGDRTVLSDNADYPGPPFQPYTSCMDVNITEQVAYVGDRQQKRVLAVDMTTGERVIAIR